MARRAPSRRPSSAGMATRPIPDRVRVRSPIPCPDGELRSLRERVGDREGDHFDDLRRARHGAARPGPRRRRRGGRSRDLVRSRPSTTSNTSRRDRLRAEVPRPHAVLVGREDHLPLAGRRGRHRETHVGRTGPSSTAVGPGSRHVTGTVDGDDVACQHLVGAFRLGEGSSLRPAPPHVARRIAFVDGDLAAEPRRTERDGPDFDSPPRIECLACQDDLRSAA